MIVNGRKLVIKPTFVRQLDEILDYIEHYSPLASKTFLTELDIFCRKKSPPGLRAMGSTSGKGLQKSNIVVQFLKRNTTSSISCSPPKSNSWPSFIRRGI